jgi:PAS domain S-box-containing protein
MDVERSEGPRDEDRLRDGDQLGFDIERDLLCTADAGGYFLSLNAAWERALGWSRDELMRRPMIEFVHPDDVQRTTEEASKVVRPDYHIVNFENRYRTKGGGWRWLRWSARSDGETWFAVAFDVTEQREARARLRGALSEDRLVAYSQPILDQRLERVIQEELLARLRGEDGGGRIIEADEFLPEAERCGLIGVVDRWMAMEAVALARRGRPAEVNLSARTIEDEELTRALADELHSAGRSARSVVFEITETAAIDNLDAAREFAERLSKLGCRFALDDFGTGFGSLTYLRHLPLEFLKIDTSFVRNLTRSEADQALVRGVVAIARELGLHTVAEGVEDAATLRMLREFGVDHVQGYLFGLPRPLAPA